MLQCNVAKQLLHPTNEFIKKCLNGDLLPTL